jgi:D-alanyl-lipoteichoic acid acyltransferase DltB (MBOAT superfamily)
MVFNSLLFLVFFTLVSGAQYLPLSWTGRKLVLTLLSYLFYAAWYPPTIVILWASTCLDWIVTREMVRTERQSKRRLLLLASLAFNFGVLGYFKYSGFVLDNLSPALAALGVHVPAGFIPHVLPVGISFYTFMSLAYVIDVYRGVTKPVSSLVDFALYLTFYPHLVAGPIVRSQDFLPQLETPRRAAAADFGWGLLLLLFGLFQKVVVADALLAPIADRVFTGGASANLVESWAGALAFSGQIFCDFAGYSTCAVGAAACLGFRLPENFRRPYAALGFTDFWRRWHITLSSWLRDYLYISLGGNRVGKWRTLFNLMLTMLLGGLWHGAAWNFVIWGGLHGLFLCTERELKPLLTRAPARWLAAARPLGVALTFVCVTFAWVFFRARTFHEALAVARGMVGLGRHGSTGALLHPLQVATALVGVGFMLLIHLHYRDSSLRQALERKPSWVVAAAVACLVFVTITTAGEDRAFIYFQF